tara:strand:- start:567 stop:827 length:261 start_codon:yes stop_codon:yes gene_type:complete
MAQEPIQTTASDRLLTKAEAADFLGIAPRTLDDWRAAKVIPVIERRGYVRFLRSDLEDFLQRHRIEARKASPYRPRKAKKAASSNP